MNVTRTRRFTAGLCPRCGERPLHRNRKACFPCLRKGAEWVARRRALQEISASLMMPNRQWVREMRDRELAASAAGGGR